MLILGQFQLNIPNFWSNAPSRAKKSKFEVMFFWYFRGWNPIFRPKKCFEVSAARICFLANFSKMLITFDWGLLERNGVHFWRLCFFEVSEPKIWFFDKKIILKFQELKYVLWKFQYNAHNFWLRAPRAKWSSFLEFIFFLSFKA